VCQWVASTSVDTLWVAMRGILDEQGIVDESRGIVDEQGIVDESRGIVD